jgi:hypothetical protein
MWSAGGRCPAEGCNFAFRVESDDETELDVVGAVAMEAHSRHTHGGLPVTVGSFQIAPKMQEIGEDEIEDEERPRLIN